MGGKGSTFERDVSKDLTKWLTGKVKPYKYWRNILSGGLVTIDKENCDLSGDIRALTSEAEFLTNVFSIELKTGYPKTSFWQFFKDAKTFGIKKFWEQCQNDVKESNKSGMLIYRKLGRKPIVGIQADMYSILGEITQDLQNLPRLHMQWRNGCLPEIVFFDYKEFFEIVKPEHIIKIYKMRFGSK